MFGRFDSVPLGGVRASVSPPSSHTPSQRMPSRKSSVDETLFASKAKQSSKGVGVVTLGHLRKLMADPSTSGSISVINGKEFERMQALANAAGSGLETSPVVAKSLGSTGTMGRSSMRTAQKDRVRALQAQRRKERILALERKRHAQSVSNVSELARDREDEKNTMLKIARDKLDEEIEDVKMMNKLALYAECVAKREAQIREKEERVKETIARQRALDAEMERCRLEDIEKLEARNALRAKEQEDGKKILLQQIHDRDAARQRRQEQMRKESEQMVKAIEKLNQDQQHARQQKLADGRNLLKQIMSANQMQAQAKLKRKQEMIEEDLRIAAYLREKEIREQELARQQEERKAEKEREIGRLRAAQERAQDRRNELEELRNRRYQEAKEREWRNNEAQMARDRSNRQRELEQARRQQQADKIQRMKEEADRERQDFERNLSWQREQAEIEAQQQAERDRKRLEHRQTLLKQMSDADKRNERSRIGNFDEGKQFRMEMEAERKRLLRIKEKKLAELRHKGVPDKFCADLKNYEVLKTKLFA